MPLWQYNSCILGYQAHLRELLSASVFSGYYSGYYHPMNKHKKSPTEILKKMFRTKKRGARKQEVDVEAFRALEQAFEAKRKEKGAVVKGGRRNAK